MYASTYLSSNCLIIRFGNIFFKEEQDKDNRAHEVAEAVRASGNFNNRKPKKKRQNIHFGKT